jgi:leucyl aminopeptidase (aminopeptidase T)
MIEPTPAELASAAHTLVQGTLRLAGGENLVVVADAESNVVAQAIRVAGEDAGAHVTLARIDDMHSVSTNHSGDRPHKVLPDGLRRAMNATQASVFVASAPHQERSMREQLYHLVHSREVRHPDMPDVTPVVFARAFALGYDKVAQWGKGMIKRLELARVVETESPKGTRLRVTMTDPVRWVARLGAIGPGQCVAFPAGKLLGAVESVDGTFVADASVGEFFGGREGLLLRTPVKLTLEAGRVVRAEAPLAKELEGDLQSTLTFAPNSDRVGLVSIGVNMGLLTATGVAAADLNLPGLHLVVGDPCGRDTGVAWSARTAFAACQAGARVTVDRSAVIEAGKIVGVQ